MSKDSKIEWTDHTFNPWEGCQKISPGCDNCYAESRNARFAGGTAVNWGPGAPRRRTTPTNWSLPIRWNAYHDDFFEQHGRRQRVFCASLADVFDNAVAAQWRADLFDLIDATPNLDWLLLTKRIGNAAGMLPWGAYNPPWPNVWLGATIVNQEEADRDIPKLLRTPAAIHFLSMEPLLGPVDLERHTLGSNLDQVGGSDISQHCMIHSCIDWVIVGGESGHGARAMHPDWARSLRDQCGAANAPFLFKQWGEWLPISQGGDDWYAPLYRSRVAASSGQDQSVLDDIYGKRCTVPQLCLRINGQHVGITAPCAFLQGTHPMLAFRVGKTVAGRLLDGRTYDQFPGVR